MLPSAIRRLEESIALARGTVPYSRLIATAAKRERLPESYFNEHPKFHHLQPSSPENKPKFEFDDERRLSFFLGALELQITVTVEMVVAMGSVLARFLGIPDDPLPTIWAEDFLNNHQLIPGQMPTFRPSPLDDPVRVFSQLLEWKNLYTALINPSSYGPNDTFYYISCSGTWTEECEAIFASKEIIPRNLSTFGAVLTDTGIPAFFVYIYSNPALQLGEDQVEELVVPWQGKTGQTCPSFFFSTASGFMDGAVWHTCTRRLSQCIQHLPERSPLSRSLLICEPASYHNQDRTEELLNMENIDVVYFPYPRRIGVVNVSALWLRTSDMSPLQDLRIDPKLLSLPSLEDHPEDLTSTSFYPTSVTTYFRQLGGDPSLFWGMHYTSPPIHVPLCFHVNSPSSFDDELLVEGDSSDWPVANPKKRKAAAFGSEYNESASTTMTIGGTEYYILSEHPKATKKDAKRTSAATAPAPKKRAPQAAPKKKPAAKASSAPKTPAFVPATFIPPSLFECSKCHRFAPKKLFNERAQICAACSNALAS